MIAAVDRLRNQAVVSHFAAAAVWGLDVWRPWPTTIDVLVPRGAGRSSGSFRRHGCDFERHESVPFGRHLITTPAQTAIDIATLVPFPEGVVTIDSLLRSHRHGDAIHQELDAAIDRVGGLPGTRRAVASRRFADPRSESALESFSRARIAEFGFPAPELQTEFAGPGDFRARVDFWWPGVRVIGEADGHAKYGDEDDPEAARRAVLREKSREDTLRRRSTGFARWGYDDAVHPTRLQSILDTAGVPRESRRLFP